MDATYRQGPTGLLSRRWLRPMIIGVFLAGLGVLGRAQALDICGCANFPGLQPFDGSDAATWPAGTALNGSTLVIPLPPDGILRFSSFTSVNRYFSFTPNAANTPVTILVAGNFSFTGTGCCYYMSLTGSRGSNGSGATAGVGGLGGPGAFRGGDGASQAINGAAVGGAGFGPGGGQGGAISSCIGVDGEFLGVPELMPLVGGSGGGGGCSTSASSSSCSGGGGGGGGGAILIAVNGTLTMANTQIIADGAYFSNAGNGGCSSGGGAGAGGAIRLVTNRFVQGAEVDLFTRGAEGNGGSNGRIRLESVDPSAQTAFSANPFAQRIVGPTPLANPLSPSVSITSVGGSATPVHPQGLFGGIDIVLPAPGVASVDLVTSGVPSGTTVQVTVKPRIGAAPLSQTIPLTNCNGAGSCQATALFNLSAGAYVVEARATFQAQ